MVNINVFVSMGWLEAHIECVPFHRMFSLPHVPRKTDETGIALRRNTAAKANVFLMCSY
jgi:hypothetical protein